MEHLFVTRAQYDMLINYRPDWMALRWNSDYTCRQWALGGVYVRGSIGAIEDLKLHIEEVTLIDTKKRCSLGCD